MLANVVFSALLLGFVAASEHHHHHGHHQQQQQPNIQQAAPHHVEEKKAHHASTASESVCCSPDIVVLIDRSFVDKNNYQTTVRPIVSNLFKNLKSCADVRASFVEYGSSVHIRSLLGDYKTLDSLRRYADAYTPGSSSLGTKSLLADALDGVQTQILTVGRGKRPESSTFVLLFIGKDAPNHASVIAKADQLKTLDPSIKILVFTLDSEVPAELAQGIAGTSSLVFPLHGESPRVVCSTICQIVCPKAELKVLKAEQPEEQHKEHQPFQSTIVRPFHRNQVKTGQIRKSERLTLSERCLEHNVRRGRQHIDDPENCHLFIECTYANQSHAIGVTKSCDANEIFNADAMTCVPEGPSPCSDYCRHSDLARNGCYGLKDNCATFFLCVHGTSYAKCCPAGTRFDPESCGCIFDASTENKCTSTCKLAEQSAAFQKIESAPSDITCIDSYNNTLRVHQGRPDLYEVVEAGERGPKRTFTVPCASGSLFSVDTCRCEHLFNDDRKAASRFVKGRQCRLYLPFDEDLSDHSTNKFSVYTQGRVELNKKNDSAVGEGRSLLINNGFLEIPGLSGSDQRNHASWCLFYRCQQHHDSFTCSKSGGLLSNSKDAFGTSYSIVLASQNKNQIVARVRLVQPIMSISINASVDTAQGWNQVCVVYDGGNIELYSNGVSVGREEAHGRLPVVAFPYLIGTDHRYGTFVGSIDEVLMCDHAMSRQEVEAHYDGNRDYLVKKGLIPGRHN